MYPLSVINEEKTMNINDRTEFDYNSESHIIWIRQRVFGSDKIVTIALDEDDIKKILGYIA